MATHTVLQFSPARSPTQSSTRRSNLPTSEKNASQITTVIAPLSSASTWTTSGRSPMKKSVNPEDAVLDTQFNVKLEAPTTQLQEAVQNSKHVNLSFPLIRNGRYVNPPSSQAWNEIRMLFPDTFSAEINPPYLVIRVRKLPPKQPFTVAGVALWLTTDPGDTGFQRGWIGKGGSFMEHVDLQDQDRFSKATLRQVADGLRQFQPRRILWFGPFWQITLRQPVPIERLPGYICGQRAYYRLESELPPPDLAALRAQQQPLLKYFDDTNYAVFQPRLLRPGVMFSGSKYLSGPYKDNWDSTSSGILVSDANGKKFVTVASHGFRPDGLVWHPNPEFGSVIGRIVQKLPNCGVSLIKLNKGISYINELFGADAEPHSPKVEDYLEMDDPGVSNGDRVWMDNPFSGRCHGLIGARGMDDLDDFGYVPVLWNLFENTSLTQEPIQASCGSPIMHEKKGKLLSFFRYLHQNGTAYGIEAVQLREKHGIVVVNGCFTF